MSAKHLTLCLPPETFSWLTRKAEREGIARESYVQELIEQARTLDGMRGKEIRHLDGDRASTDPASLEVRESGS